MMLEKSFWFPKVAGNFTNCPIPYRLDSYQGCHYGCLYCNKRQFVEYFRKDEFVNIKALDCEKFEEWVQKANVHKGDNAHKVAFIERIPIKIGCFSDPFPMIEMKERITYNTLKILERYDYPISISTKNPGILAEYFSDFNNPNWVIAVTIISIDNEFSSIIEPFAPSIDERFSAIKRLTTMGAKVIVRVQPTIYPKILKELPDLLARIKESGAFGVVLEGLKLKRTMTKKEQGYLKGMNDYLGYDIREWFKMYGAPMGAHTSDYEYTKEQKLEYINLAKSISKELSLECFIGENDLRNESCDGECCGTECLRNHKVIKDSNRLLNCKAAGIKGNYYFSNKQHKGRLIKDYF